MTFDEILDQALALLQRRGRLTYRALQRQFNLDDAYLGGPHSGNHSRPTSRGR
jgi:hypothetical protein